MPPLRFSGKVGGIRVNVLTAAEFGFTGISRDVLLERIQLFEITNDVVRRS
jgi:hypothetical protein